MSFLKKAGPKTRIAVLFLSLFPLLFLGWLLGSHNVYVIADGQVVRSAQPDKHELSRLVREYDIRAVISLRGLDNWKEWYREEEAWCEDLGVGFFTVEANADQLPSVKAVRGLLHAWDTFPRPFLVHCMSGQDRTGLASVMFELLNGTEWDEAMKQLSWRYLHICKKSNCPLHRFFRMYRGWLKEEGRPHSVSSFRHWCADVYVPPPYAAFVRVLSFPERATPRSKIRGAVRVTNLSKEPWTLRSSPGEGIRFGIRVLGPVEALNPAPGENLEAYFHHHRFQAKDILRVGMKEDTWPPGQTRDLTFTFSAPKIPGTYLYRFDMVDEMVNWFYVRGYPAKYRFLTIPGQT